jgi:Transposase IS116/IS110/IS902 family
MSNPKPRYAGLTGSPDESGTKRREKGLARSGNARVRRGMIQLAWRFLMFQRNSALAQASDRLVAACARGRGAGPASFCALRNKRRLLKAPNSFGPVRPLVTVADDGSRWRVPVCAMAVMPRKRMGPPLRSHPKASQQGPKGQRWSSAKKVSTSWRWLR